jgi:D-xylose transport system substrate-binding protein
MDSIVVERWTRDRDIFMATAREIGADVILQVGEQSAELQASQVQYLIDKGVDVLVVIPNDAERLTRVVAAAKKKGIKVVCYDRLVRNANADLYISFDNYRVGVLQGEAIAKLVPSGTIAIINGASTDLNALQYNKGNHSVLDPLVASGRYTIVGEKWTDAWRSEWSTEQTRELLDEGIVPAGVIAANDMLAEASIKVLAEHRLAGKVVVVGHDAELGACQRIAAGTQAMTVYKPLRDLATKAAEFAVLLARGQKLPTDYLINDGSYDVPYYKIEPIAVYASNLRETVIDSGFHSAADVYR